MMLYPGGQGTYSDTHFIYIPRVSKNVELARAFAFEQLLSEEAQTWSFVYYGKLPTLLRNFEKLPADNPNVPLVRHAIQNVVIWPVYDYQMLSEGFAEMLQLYILDEISLDDMLAELDAISDSADLTSMYE